MQNWKTNKIMIITNEDRLNLIYVLEKYQYSMKLTNSEVGLDFDRWSDLMQRLIDKEDKYESKNKVQANDCSQN